MSIYTLQTSASSVLKVLVLVSLQLVSGAAGGLIIVLCTKAIIYMRDTMISVADDVRKKYCYM